VNVRTPELLAVDDELALQRDVPRELVDREIEAHALRLASGSRTSPRMNANRGSPQAKKNDGTDPCASESRTRTLRPRASSSSTTHRADIPCAARNENGSLATESILRTFSKKRLDHRLV
jgi:hypothetical protein